MTGDWAKMGRKRGMHNSGDCDSSLMKLKAGENPPLKESRKIKTNGEAQLY